MSHPRRSGQVVRRRSRPTSVPQNFHRTKIPGTGPISLPRTQKCCSRSETHENCHVAAIYNFINFKVRGGFEPYTFTAWCDCGGDNWYFRGETRLFCGCLRLFRGDDRLILKLKVSSLNPSLSSSKILSNHYLVFVSIKFILFG